MRTIDRVSQFIDSQGISKNEFDKRIDAANGYIGKQIKKGASIGSDVIERIVSAFPQLSLEWLVTGKGEMMKGNQYQRAKEEIVPLSVSETAERYKTTQEGVIYDLFKRTNEIKSQVLHENPTPGELKTLMLELLQMTGEMEKKIMELYEKNLKAIDYLKKDS